MERLTTYARERGYREPAFLLNPRRFDWYVVSPTTMAHGGPQSWPHAAFP